MFHTRHHNAPLSLMLQTLLLCLMHVTPCGAQDKVLLIESDKSNGGFTFDNGREFPGANGSIELVDTEQGKAVKLKGDFSGGGAYVQTLKNLPKIDPGFLSMDVKLDGVTRLTMRLIDGTGQCHQISLRAKDTTDWQTITLPVHAFFEHMGQSNAVDSVIKYERWSGANDGKWHAPIKLIALIIGKPNTPDKKCSMLVRNLYMIDTPLAQQESPNPATSVNPSVKAAWLNLPLLIEEYADMSTFAVGKDNTARIAVASDADGQQGVTVAYHFGSNGYAGAVKKFADSPINHVQDIQLQLRSDTVNKIGIQLIDGTGQTHQTKALPLTADGQWHTYTYPLSQLVGTESWSGANDRQWHEPLTQINVNIGSHDAKTDAQLDIKAIRVNGVSSDPTLIKPENVTIDFEDAKAIDRWELADQTVQRQSGQGVGNTTALMLIRTEAQVLQLPVLAVSPTFPAVKGWWKISGTFASDLYSPDNSFAGTTDLECLDATGNSLERIHLDHRSKQTDWQVVSRDMRLPDLTASIRFVIELKKTHGTYRIDNLSASFIKPIESSEDLIERIVVKSKALGNLFMPEDAIKLDVQLLAKRPLSEANRQITWQVADYWGVEQTPLSTLTVEKAGRDRDGLFEYKGLIDLSGFKATTGRYYELQLTALRDAPRAYKDYRSFAVLPEAAARKYNWREIPFSSRNWDNRIGEYIDLSARLGLPIIGAWTGWEPKEPYKVNLPGVKRILEHNAAVMCGTPVGLIEKHHGNWDKYDDASIRNGLKALLQAVDQTHALVTMGNEPPPNLESAKATLWAYKAVYETAKQINPDVTMVGTSVGPEEDYFKAGVHQYCDVVDFHVYESHQRIREVFKRYDELFDKYGHRKPIWSTEIGLNSQGVPRRDVASSLIKKFSIFFASGGENISWFGLLYPDRNGKSSGSSGDSHNVFDCRYMTYSPRLDAIAYYNMVNSIAVKKFVTEQKYANDVEAYLFADKQNNQLQILWTDKTQQTVFVPLEGVNDVTVTYVDGLVRPMHAGGKGVTLLVSQDPILLQYQSAIAKLADALPVPTLMVSNMPTSLVMGGQVQLACSNTLPNAHVSLHLPQQWGKQDVLASNGNVTLQVPAQTSARYLPVSVQLHDDQQRLCGEIRSVLPIVGRIAMQVRPALEDSKPVLNVKITNNGYEAENVSWNAVFNASVKMNRGSVQWSKPGPAANSFVGQDNGMIKLPGQKSQTISLPVTEVYPMQIDRVVVSVKDSEDRQIQVERFVSAFCGVPHTSDKITLDGSLDESDWSRAPVQIMDQADQYRNYSDKQPWEGKDDLSAKIRFLWDETHLYLAIEATDDVHRVTQMDGMLWAQDGVQLLIDPTRGNAQQGGKYDIVMGLDAKGNANAWCHLAADPAIMTGPAPEIKLAVQRDESRKRTLYEIAIPWSRISPFKPEIGGNLGMAVALNDDDGIGRNAFMSWFADVHDKQTDGVADLILLP